MKLLGHFFGVLWIGGFAANCLLFMYVEWLYVSRNFLQIFNPLLHFQVMETLLTTPLFWILLVITGVGLGGMYQVSKRIESDG